MREKFSIKRNSCGSSKPPKMAKAKKEKAPSASSIDPGNDLSLDLNLLFRRICCFKLLKDTESTL